MELLKREFIELFKSSGWSQAELARQLYMTRGGVNGIITGTAVPSESALELLRLKLAIAGRPQFLGADLLKEKSADYNIESKLAALPSKERAEVMEIFTTIVKQAEKRVSYTKQQAKKPKPAADGS